MQNPSSNLYGGGDDDDGGDKTLNELPKARFWEAMDIAQWEGFWFEPNLIKPAITFKSTFHARDDDVILASTMKTGTTWLKALSLSILTRGNGNYDDDDVLATDSPHFHVPTVESTVYSTKTLAVDIYDASSPRLLHTHLPYAVLPDSVKDSGCRVVYIARNPKDTLISTWHFFNKILNKPFPLEKALECFVGGVHQYGPFFDHVAEYWRESTRRPEKMMFVKYEDLIGDPKGQVSKIAEFVGRPFANEAEVDEVLWRCSLERLKNLEVNKSGSIMLNVPNSCYFRKGEVGGWKAHLTPEMEDRIDRISRAKFEPLGLFF